MTKLYPLEHSDCHHLIQFNAGKDATYLRQWAGPSVYTYPLTEDQILKRLQTENVKVFKIVADGLTVGSVELNDIDVLNGCGRVCRFIIADGYSGRGFGQSSLSQLIEYAKNEMGLKTLDLNVFAFNKSAIGCYEKMGFEIIKISENIEAPEWSTLLMRCEIV